MAGKVHTLKGSDCFNDDIELSVSRTKTNVKVVTEHGDQFCCLYDDLVKVVKAMEPKPKKKKKDDRTDANA